MSSTIGAEHTGHVIARFATRLHTLLDELVDAPAWSMTQQEQRAALVELTRAEARISELRLRVLAAGDRSDIAAESAASSTAAWLAHATSRAPSGARDEVRLAGRLDTTCTATRDALAAGRVSLAQAAVIVGAVVALPSTVEPGVRAIAETHLIGLAADHHEKELKVLGRRVLEVVDPATADDEDGRRLAAEETAAARACYLQLHDNGDGTHTGRFKVPTLHAAMLKKMLHAFLAPRHMHATQVQLVQTAGSAGDPAGRPGAGPVPASRPEQLGQALCELLERFPANRLPRAGGVSATVVVLLDYEKLLSGLGTAKLDTGEHLSAAEARRLACDAGIIPAVYRHVLGGRPVVLDLGRTRRFHTSHQRIALAIQQGGCTAESCDRPPGWCHTHHDGSSWATGGGTSLEHGRLLCPFHHGIAHHPRYHMEHLPHGRVRFHRTT